MKKLWATSWEKKNGKSLPVVDTDFVPVMPQSTGFPQTSQALLNLLYCLFIFLPNL